jgi:hypothetical protein
MAAPTASLLAPANGSTDADLSPCSVVWTPASGETLATASFTAQRDGADIPFTFTHLGGGAILIEAEAGLFPDEVAVVVEFGAENTLGDAATINTTFDTRAGFSGSGGARVTNADSHAGAASVLALVTFYPSGDGCRLRLESYIVSGDFQRLRFEAYQFTGAADIGALLITATKPINEVLGMCVVSIGPETKSAALIGADLDGPMSALPASEAVSVYGEGHNRPAGALLDPAIPGLDTAGVIAAIGDVVEAAASVGIDTDGGDAIEATIELLSALLDSLRL